MSTINLRAYVLGAALLAAVILPVSAHAATNLVTDPSFEDGSLAGWTIAPGFAAFHYGGPGFVHTGIYGAALDNMGHLATMTQEIPTTPGTDYQVQFWLASPLFGNPNSFQAYFGGVALNPEITDTPTTYTEYTYLTGPATSTSSLLEFDWQTSHNDGAYMALDDVSVTAAVPCPPAVWQGSLALTVLGIAAGVKRYRRVAA